MEKQIRPGIYLSVITREDYVERASNLTREELTIFIMKAHPLRFAQTPDLIGNDIGREELIRNCMELEPELDLEEDYYVIRETPKNHD